VRHRQVGQRDAGRVAQTRVVEGALDLKHDVFVGQLHALWWAGGARSEEHGQGVGRLDRVDPGLQLVLFCRVLTQFRAASLELGEGWGAVGLLEEDHLGVADLEAF
jgi:hypothetical protein